MTDLTPITFAETDIDRIAGHTGRIAVLIDSDGRLDAGARRVNKPVVIEPPVSMAKIS